MRNIKITIEYDGTAYAGWQRQAPPHTTIQELVEEALFTMTGTHTIITGAGRTDAGVHARAQVANFRTNSQLATERFLLGLNTLLPRDIAIASVAEVDDTFDARRSALNKTYTYRIWNRRIRSPLHERFSWHLYRPLNLAHMAEAAALLIGEHDFSAFRSAKCDRKTTVRHLQRLDVTCPEPDLVAISAQATAFLKQMVRILVGTLVEVGLGIRTPTSVLDILHSRDRRRAGRTAPAHGLTLEHVEYDKKLAKP